MNTKACTTGVHKVAAIPFNETPHRQVAPNVSSDALGARRSFNVHVTGNLGYLNRKKPPLFECRLDVLQRFESLTHIDVLAR